MTASDLSNLKPCRFCGCTVLSYNLWHIDSESTARRLGVDPDAGEIEAIECHRCLAGAPLVVWQDQVTFNPQEATDG